MSEPTFRCRVYGLPVGQGRPRATIRRNWKPRFEGDLPKPMVYDPPEARDWKRTIVAQAIPEKPERPFECPVSMRLLFYFARPQTITRPWPSVRPDVTNLAKAIEDALNGIVYLDDAQIVDLHVRKEYGSQPGVEILIWHLGKNAAAPPEQTMLLFGEAT